MDPGDTDPDDGVEPPQYLYVLSQNSKLNSVLKVVASSSKGTISVSSPLPVSKPHPDRRDEVSFLILSGIAAMICSASVNTLSSCSQRAKSILLPILASPRLSSELSESNGNDVLLSHLVDELPSNFSLAELDLNASAIFMPLSIEGLLTRLLSKLLVRPFWDNPCGLTNTPSLGGGCILSNIVASLMWPARLAAVEACLAPASVWVPALHRASTTAVSV